MQRLQTQTRTHWKVDFPQVGRLAEREVFVKGKYVNISLERLEIDNSFNILTN